ncbi:Alpha/Beta hydrolase protein [Mycena belliarum]|uniref:Carboxylic ester hydrolase n=1 Tax=Mycena belliarum TaxID=1033014 RepID=A0AAD6U652_9AGAR|nr:Alpha/Beta hydrolase protein [Mycena belliae]
MPVPSEAQPVLLHSGLGTAFYGIQHASSTPATPIHQYRGIKYASIPARFRQSHLVTTLPPKTDASCYGPICPQLQKKSFEEELFGLGRNDVPQQALEQDEFECLNLNITCPAGLTSQSRVPVMLWVHGGGDRGYGSSWVYDGGSIVRKSMLIEKPVIVVTFNFRIGLFGFAASNLIRADNAAAGDVGVGNYALYDQRTAMEWIHRFILEFGGDPNNVTVFGESSGAADILFHLLSKPNEHRPLFHRAIIQSAVIDHIIPDVSNAGWHISRLMGSLDVSTVEQLRSVSAEKLVKISFGSTLRAVDDGHFFLPDWRTHFLPEDRTPSPHHVNGSKSSHEDHHSSRPHSRLHSSKRPVHQPLIIGDTGSASLTWSLPASLWTSSAVVRRLNAICQSISAASSLLSSYDICVSTPDDEIVDRVLELIGDTRIAWPTECVASRARSRRAGEGVWRYVFDQEAPASVTHKADLAYLFDNVPNPFPTSPSSGPAPLDFCDSFDLDDDADEHDLKFDSDEEDEWMEPPVDEWAYTRVRDAIQERWIAFAHGEEPWRSDKVYVFGPEGEVGERSRQIFESRRRRAVWREALEPLGMQLAQKVGLELSRGPPIKSGQKH